MPEATEAQAREQQEPLPRGVGGAGWMRRLFPVAGQATGHLNRWSRGHVEFKMRLAHPRADAKPTEGHGDTGAGAGLPLGAAWTYVHPWEKEEKGVRLSPGTLSLGGARREAKMTPQRGGREAGRAEGALSGDRNGR